MADRTPRQIIGDDAYMQLVFEGYEVISADSLASKDTALSEIRAELAEALENVERYVAVAREEKDRLAAAESELARVKKALEPFAVLARASDRLAAEGQRRLQPEESADLTDAEIASLVMPDEQVVMTDGRMAFGHDQHPSKPVRVTMGDLRAASRSISQDVEERA